MRSMRSRLWRTIALAAIPGPVLVPAWTSARAEVPGATQYTYEHSNGLWIGVQNDNLRPQKEDFLLLDQGKLSSLRSSTDDTDQADYSYTFGTDEVGHVVNEAGLQWNFKRTTSRHTLNLGIGGKYQAYRGTISRLSLDEQFSLSLGQNGVNDLNDIEGWDANISASDLIRVGQNTDASVAGGHQLNRTDSNSRGEDTRTLDTLEAALEQRWYQSSLRFTLRLETLLAKVDNDGDILDFRSRQNTRERDLRYRFAVSPRVTAMVGYKDIYLDIKDGQSLYRQGPQVGLQFTGETFGIETEVSELWDEEGREETFAKGLLNWQLDPYNRLNASLEKKVSLQSVFPLLPGEGEVLLRPQEKVIEGQIIYDRIFGRQKMLFTLGRGETYFEGSTVFISSGSLAYEYKFSELDIASSVLSANQTKFDGEPPLGESLRKIGSWLFTYRRILRGTLSATGGRLFLAGTTGVERFEETSTDFRSNRVIALLSLGQSGNF